KVPLWDAHGEPPGSAGYTVRKLLPGSYGHNLWLTIGNNDSKKWAPLFYRRESEIVHPSLTPVFADSQTVHSGPETNSPPSRDLYFDDYPGVNAMGCFTIARHGQKGTAHGSLPVEPGESLSPWVNTLACFDGHVERAKLDDLWRFYWNKEWVPPVT